MRASTRGPFVLVHGDLELFNLLVDDNMDIIAVLDWEWSRVVPRQFFIPPLVARDSRHHQNGV
jgi:aminoglycoside phosphotransferase (APT) family kinase protein